MNKPSTPEEALKALFAYCRARDWAGQDPYDALNSRILGSVLRGNKRVLRLVLTQVLKRSPVNIRALLRVPPTQNPKALALILRATLKLEGRGLVDTVGLSDYFIDRIAALRSLDADYWCWGYSFPWQTRTLMVPRGAPNLVCTTFVADALLDAWEATRQPHLFQMARSAAKYIARELYFEESSGAASFAYPRPDMKSHIHNANFLAAALLSRVHARCPDALMLTRALAVARFSASRQQADGSWYYGEAPAHRWIDNFHTGYNLHGLRVIGRSLGTPEFDERLRRGLGYYRAHFIKENGAPRYFNNKTYPIDIHCVAQTILTMLECSDYYAQGPQYARRVYDWAMQHMWDRQGFFYYRVLRLGTIRISYMRWSQAWMLLALASLVEHYQSSTKRAGTTSSSTLL